MRLGWERDPGMGWGGDEAEMGEESRYGLRWGVRAEDFS